MSFFKITRVITSLGRIHDDILSVPGQHGCAGCKLVVASLIGIATALGLAASFALARYIIAMVPATLTTSLKHHIWLLINLIYRFFRRYLSLITCVWNALGIGERLIVSIIW